MKALLALRPQQTACPSKCATFNSHLADGSIPPIERHGRRYQNWSEKASATNQRCARAVGSSATCFSCPVASGKATSSRDAPQGLEVDPKSERSIVSPLRGTPFSLCSYRVVDNSSSSRGNVLCCTWYAPRGKRPTMPSIDIDDFHSLSCWTPSQCCTVKDRGAARNRPRGRTDGVQGVIFDKRSLQRHPNRPPTHEQKINSAGYISGSEWTLRGRAPIRRKRCTLLVVRDYFLRHIYVGEFYAPQVARRGIV